MRRTKLCEVLAKVQEAVDKIQEALEEASKLDDGLYHPEIGDIVKRGPGWNGGDEDTRDDGLGIGIVVHEMAVGTVGVAWFGHDKVSNYEQYRTPESQEPSQELALVYRHGKE
jgi:hypothetical protein